MSLRLKIVLALMLLATAATAAVGISSYVSTGRQLDDVVNNSLDNAAQIPLTLVRGPGGVLGQPAERSLRSLEQILVQVIDTNGGIRATLSRSGQIPVDDTDIAIAQPDSSVAKRRDITIGGEPYRLLTIPIQGGGAEQLARSLRENEDSLDAIRRHTLLAMGIVVVVSALAGWLIGRTVTRRLVRLTDVAGVVASTGRLDVDVPTAGSDETGQLGRAFSGMLGALARSRQEQTQLVQDAGHELRTPLTSLRTNVSVLRQFDQLDPVARAQLVADLDSESKELTALVNELVELATDQRDTEPMQPVVLGEIAERAASRTRRRTGRDVLVIRDDTIVNGQPAALERAMQNLVDNAAKFAPLGPIEVAVQADGETMRVAVRDHGGGIQAADLPHVFDRFFRAVDKRSAPGSGLGLAIVKSIVDHHGGTVFATNAPDGGAVIGFALPTG